ncbi:hypothetical protein B0H11DRAFT_769759 [Mycena galericulata]|nr:hypothetical protein B0H11DRAFT_769759 [Mycena galericulata]
MPGGSSEFHTFHNYISGGVGGHGGGGGVRGQGGGGGVGEGPRLNYDINTEHFKMTNLRLQIYNQGEAGIHILHSSVALEALYNSAESFPQPRCHPETRTELLDKLYQWATGPQKACSIQWLHGPAGAGKSAVMRTLCQRLQDNGQLSGSFFFKRGHTTRGNAKMLFATLAYQLALHRPELREPISQIVERDPSILAREMDVQLRTLILEPSKLLKVATLPVLLIDGLDECEGRNIQRKILCLIVSAFNDNRHSLRIIVASRPEPDIRETLQQKSLPGLFDSTDIGCSFEDVRTYLRDELSRIHREHRTTVEHIPTPWPSPQILEMLVCRSSGYFIYASTVIKFIDDEYSRPSQRLDIIQNIVPHDSESPFALLDELYIQILSDVSARYRPRLCDILSVILNYPLALTVEDTEELLGLEPGDVSLILRPLHSVLTFWSERNRIDVHHASFRDFLNNQARSSIFYVGSPQYQFKVASTILKALAYNHEDRQKNLANSWNLRWDISARSSKWMGFIASLPPSADFVPLVERINPDFVFRSKVEDATLKRFLLWLKI